MILIAAVLWGTVGTAKAFARAGADSISMGAMRLLVGGLVLMAVAVLMVEMTLKGWPLRSVMLLDPSMALFQPFFSTEVSQTGVAVGTVRANGSVHVLYSMIERITIENRPSDSRWR